MVEFVSAEVPASETEAPSPLFFEKEKIVWTVRDVASVLSCSERHIRKLIACEKIPHTKVGRLVRFHRIQILEWISKGGTR